MSEFSSQERKKIPWWLATIIILVAILFGNQLRLTIEALREPIPVEDDASASSDSNAASPVLDEPIYRDGPTPVQAMSH